MNLASQCPGFVTFLATDRQSGTRVRPPNLPPHETLCISLGVWSGTDTLAGAAITLFSVYSRRT